MSYSVAELQRRASATFEFLRFRKRDYQNTFATPAGARVLVDLAKFCRADDSCFHEDPRLHAVLEGRREVWLRIQKHLNLTPDALYGIYAGNPSTAIAEGASNA